MKRLFRMKKLEVPASNVTEIVEAIQLWEVRWVSRHGEYNGNVRPEIEAFATEAEAQHFAAALEAAFRLIRHTSGETVEVIQSRALKLPGFRWRDHG